MGKSSTRNTATTVSIMTSPAVRHVHATSAGIFVGNYASINVDGQECSMNERGMNVVVLDEKRKVIWTASFDTHGDDHEKMSLMKARWGN